MRPFSRRATGAGLTGVSAATDPKISDARCARALLCAGFLLACSSMAGSAGAQSFVAADLGTLPGGTTSTATALNVNGQVVGAQKP